MEMINTLYTLCGKTELKLKKEKLSQLSLPELLLLMKAEQDGKIKIEIAE